MVLSVIEEETERTLMSSQRSNSNRKSVNSDDKYINLENDKGKSVTVVE